ncbi:hypothetical protein BD410DRAFT_734965 [Rickenella mellea]|uniref:Uncharacterized protein n=1 Tax=Rickenella mellea TaxID=50990 RepID=A0A4Y7PH47_9AGAM|nr:hypothetical protein BD410DRAFT_734965 [Rickenella mellea]
MSAERRTAADRANAGSSNNNLAAEDFSFDDAEEFEAALDVHDRDRDEDNDDSHQPADVNLPPPEDIPLAEPRRDAQEIYDTSHDIWFIRILLTLVAFLHTKYHVSFRACDILLSCLNIIFLSLKLIDENTQIPRNLGTVMKKLDLEDRFTNYPICHICHRIFKPNIPVNSVCPDCDTALFKATSPTIFQRVTGKAPPPPPPVSAAPIQVLSSLLVDFLAQPGIEAAAEKWKARTHEPGKYKDIMDGNIWKSSACADGTPFFDGSDESGELRLGVTLSLDCTLRRYRAGNLLLAAMTPGPTEPTAEQLQHYLKILVDDLLKLYETGIKIITPSCPEGLLMRFTF